MNTPLARALAEGERFTPDPDEVMAGVRDGIVRRRRRHRYASAGLAGLTVLAVTGTAVLVSRSGPAPFGAAGRPSASRLARPPAGPAFTPPGTAGRPAEGPIRPVPPQQCRLSFGWLPGGLAEPLRNCGPREQGVLYPMARGRYLSVSIDQSGWSGPRNNHGWTPLSVHGRQGQIAVRPTRAFVRFPLPSGRWVDLEYGNGQPGGPSSMNLEATARRIAENISERDAGSIRVPFTAAYLPAGQHLAGATKGDGGSRFRLDYQDGSGRAGSEPATSTTQDGLTSENPRIDTGTRYSIDWSSVAGDAPSAGDLQRMERIPDIQGRPTYLLNQGSMIMVTGFHGGLLTIDVERDLPVGAQPLPQQSRQTDQLVWIAEQVHWLG